MAAESGSNPSPGGAPLSSSRSPAPDEQTGRRHKVPSILLVEDNRGDVALLSEAFRRHDVAADVTVAYDGDQAIAFIDQMESGNRPLPKLVILDLNIPKKNGHEVLAYLRRTVRCKDLVVVVLTSSEAPVDQQSVAAQGVRRYMIKPSDLAAFMEIGSVIKAALDSED